MRPTDPRSTNRIKIWSHGDAQAVGVIDPNGPQVDGVPTGWLCKRIVFVAASTNNGQVYVSDQTGNWRIVLGAGAQLECYASNTNLFQLDASAASQEIGIYMELKPE
jgi:hypothetical protein